jgi:TonB family protein
MNKLLFLGFLIISFASFAQDSNKQDAKPDKKGIKAGFGLPVTQVQPEFPGGSDSLDNFLKNNLAYPEKAKLSHTQGRVYVGFMVDRNGKIVNPRILSSASEELDNEALRVVGIMPPWKPGTAGGSPVDVQYILPIDFITPPPITKE